MKKYLYYSTILLLFFFSISIANEYYNPPADVPAASRARSAKINEIIASVDAGFDNIPPNLQDTIDGLIAGSGVYVTANDLSIGNLDGKLVVGDVITKTVQNPGGSETLLLTVPDASVTYAKIQNTVSDDILIGRISGAGGPVEELTASQARSILNIEDGADVTDYANVNVALQAAPEKTSLVDSDDVYISDSADSNNVKYITWANFKLAVKTYYDAVTSTFTNKTFDADGTGNSITNIEDADIKSGAAINADKLADGTVSNTEYQYINSLSSNAQDQLDSVSVTLATEQNTTSGSSVVFTSIPSGTKTIVFMLRGVSDGGSGNINIQIGDSGGLETSGYLGFVGNQTTGVDFSSGFSTYGNGASSTWQGAVTLSLMNASTNSWVAAVSLGDNSSDQFASGGGEKSLTAELDRVAIISSDTFDAGAVNISYKK